MDWNQLTMDDLKPHCEERGLLESGTKQEVVKRIEEYEKLQRPASQSTTSHPSTRITGPSNIPAPNLSLSEMTEEQLEQVCRDNWIPFYEDVIGIQRRATIQAEYDVKRREVIKKRNDAVDNINSKFNKEMENARKELNSRLEDLESEVQPARAKQKNWGPAFRRLKELREKRGLETLPNEYSPSQDSSPSSSFQVSQDQASVASLASQTSQASSPAPSMVSSQPVSSLNSASSPQSNSSKRRATEPDLSRSRHDSVRQRLDINHEIESEPIRSQLTGNPFIFISDRNIRVQKGRIGDMRIMVEHKGFTPTHVRADESGYFIVFESSVQGDDQAALCHQEFHHKLFEGIPMRMELWKKGVRRAGAF